MKVHIIINNYIYIYTWKTDTNWDGSSNLGHNVTLVLSIKSNQVKKGDYKQFYDFTVELVFNHRLFLIYRFMKKHDSKNAS